MTFVIGGYRAHRHLGGGSSAEVYAGRRIEDGFPVALKVMAAADLPALRREAALAAAVDHAHVPQVIDVVADDERAALVTELAAGGSLADLLVDRGRLTPAETLTVLLPLAAVLAVAHERQVLHGDLAPGNVLLDRAGRPLLADLGAGRAASEAGTPVSATPACCAPEVARGGPPTPAADLFGLGAVAFACLTGRPAWPADDLRDVVIQAGAGQWPDPGPTPERPALAGIVRTLLDPDPAVRPPAAALYLDLKAAGPPAPLSLRLGELPPVRPAREGPVGRHRLPDPTDPDPDGADPDEDLEAPPFPRPGQDPRLADPGYAARARAVTVRRDHARVDPPPDPLDPPRGGRPRGRPVLVVAAVAVLLLVAAGAGWWWARAAAPEPVAGGQLGVVTTSLPPTGPPAAGRPNGPGNRTSETRTSETWTSETWTSETWTFGTSTAGTSTAGTSTAGTLTNRSATGGSVTPGSDVPASTAPGSGPPGSGSPASGPPVSVSVTPASGAPVRGSPTSSATGTPVDWAREVIALDRARSRALAELDPAGLAAVYTADATALVADRSVIAGLRASGRRLSGAAHDITAVRVLAGGPTITVAVTESLPSYPVTDATGAVVAHTAAKGPAERVLVLVGTVSGYRIAQVSS